jgi:hypothetical protein
LVLTLDGRSQLAALDQVGWLDFDSDAIFLFLLPGSLLVGEDDLAIDAALVVY